VFLFSDFLHEDTWKVSKIFYGGFFPLLSLAFTFVLPYLIGSPVTVTGDRLP
jgi:hypothetical protein